MIARAELRYVRITPRKFRLIIPLVKGKDPETAMAILASVKKNACHYAIELLKSAVANAKIAHKEIAPSDLRISNFVANCGPRLKRFRAASMGRASMILKRTSHIIVELDAVKPAEAKHEHHGHAKKEPVRVEKPKAVKKTADKPVKAAKTKK